MPSCSHYGSTREVNRIGEFINQILIQFQNNARTQTSSTGTLEVATEYFILVNRVVFWQWKYNKLVDKIVGFVFFNENLYASFHEPVI